MWQFPNCLGAFDGKHVTIKPLKGTGSYFYNHKAYLILVLLAVANAKGEFIICDFGTNGRISNGGVIENKKFGKILANGSLSIPYAAPPSSSSEPLLFVFIGDEAFLIKDFFFYFILKTSLMNRKEYSAINWA